MRNETTRPDVCIRFIRVSHRFQYRTESALFVCVCMRVGGMAVYGEQNRMRICRLRLTPHTLFPTCVCVCLCAVRAVRFVQLVRSFVHSRVCVFLCECFCQPAGRLRICAEALALFAFGSVSVRQMCVTSQLDRCRRPCQASCASYLALVVAPSSGLQRIRLVPHNVSSSGLGGLFASFLNDANSSLVCLT